MEARRCPALARPTNPRPHLEQALGHADIPAASVGHCRQQRRGALEGSAPEAAQQGLDQVLVQGQQDRRYLLAGVQKG